MASSIKEKAAGAAANARQGISQAAQAAQEALHKQQTDPDSALNQAKETAGGIADKVKGAAASAIEKGADLLDGLADKLRGND